MLVCVYVHTGWLSGYGDGSLEHLTAWASALTIDDPNIAFDTPYAAPYGVKGRCHNDPGSQNPNTRFQCTQCETCLPVPRCARDHDNPSTGECSDTNAKWVNGNASLPTQYNMTRKDGPRCETGSSMGPSMTCTQAGTYPGASDTCNASHVQLHIRRSSIYTKKSEVKLSWFAKISSADDPIRKHDVTTSSCHGNSPCGWHRRAPSVFPRHCARGRPVW